MKSKGFLQTTFDSGTAAADKIDARDEKDLKNTVAHFEKAMDNFDKAMADFKQVKKSNGFRRSLRGILDGSVKLVVGVAGEIALSNFSGFASYARIYAKLPVAAARGAAKQAGKLTHRQVDRAPKV